MLFLQEVPHKHLILLMSNVEKELLKHQKGLLAYALSITCDIEQAKDLLQDTMLIALCNAGKYRDDGKFIYWAVTIMKNHHLNLLKKQKRQTTDGYDDIVEGALQPFVAEADTSYRCKEIRGIIASLPQAQATAFSLAIDGYSYAEIANELNIAMSDVKNHIHAARVALRKRVIR